MKNDVIVLLETSREGYTPSQCYSTLTVKELIRELEQYDEDAKVYFSNDNGYTYGAISDRDIHESTEEDEEER